MSNSFPLETSLVAPSPSSSSSNNNNNNSSNTNSSNSETSSNLPSSSLQQQQSSAEVFSLRRAFALLPSRTSLAQPNPLAINNNGLLISGFPGLSPIQVKGRVQFYPPSKELQQAAALAGHPPQLVPDKLVIDRVEVSVYGSNLLEIDKLVASSVLQLTNSAKNLILPAGGGGGGGSCSSSPNSLLIGNRSSTSSSLNNWRFRRRNRNINNILSSAVSMLSFSSSSSQISTASSVVSSINSMESVDLACVGGGSPPPNEVHPPIPTRSSSLSRQSTTTSPSQQQQQLNSSSVLPSSEAPIAGETVGDVSSSFSSNSSPFSSSSASSTSPSPLFAAPQEGKRNLRSILKELDSPFSLKKSQTLVSSKTTLFASDKKKCKIRTSSSLTTTTTTEDGEEEEEIDDEHLGYEFTFDVDAFDPLPYFESVEPARDSHGVRLRCGRPRDENWHQGPYKYFVLEVSVRFKTKSGFFSRNVTKTSLFPIIIQSYSPALVPQLLPFLPSASGKRLPILDKGYSWSEKTDFVDYDLHINRCALAYGDELRFSWRAVPSPGGQIKGIMLRVVEMCRVRPPSLRSDPDLESHLNLMDLPLMTFSEIVKFEREEEFNGQFWKKQTATIKLPFGLQQSAENPVQATGSWGVDNLQPTLSVRHRVQIVILLRHADNVEVTCAVGFAGVSLDKLDEVWRRHPNLLLNTVPPNLKSKFSTIMLSPTPAYAEAPQQQEEEDTQYGAHYQQARSRDDVDTIDIAPGPPYSATTVTDTSSSRPRMSINIPEEDPIPYNSIIGSNGESHEASRRHFVSSSTPSRSSSPTSATVAANGVPLATTTSHSSGETTSQMTTIDTNNTTNINTSTLPPLNSETYVIYTNTTATPASTTSDSTTTTTTATTTTTNFTSISTTNSPTSHHQPVRGTYRYDVSWRQDLNEINEESASSAEPLPSFYDHDPATAAANHSMLDDLVAVYTEKHMLMMDTFNNEDADHSLARPRVPNISYHPQSSSATAANERDGLAGLSSTISTSAATTLPTTAAASSKMIEAGFAIVDSQPSHDDSMNHFNNRASNSPPAIIVPQVFSDDSNHQQFPLREEYTPSSQLIQEVGGGDGVPVYEIPSIHSGNDDHHDHRAAQHPPAPPLVGGWNSPSKEEEERKVAMVNATYAAAKSATFALANPIPVYIHSNHSSALEMLPASSSTFPEDVGVVLGDEGDHYSFDVDDKRSNHSSIISNNKTLSCNDDNNIVSAHQPVIAHSLPSSKGLGYSSHSPSPSLRSTSESSSVHRQQHQILHHPQHSSADLSSVGVYDAYPLQADGNPILLGNGGGAEVADLTDHEFRTLEMLVQSIDGTHS